jgi:hypothetical protein
MLTQQLSSRHFFPKFDNLNTESLDALSSITDEDVLVITKKHSGSLLIVYAVYVSDEWQLVVNSKNGTNNTFSIAGEHYFRAQFEAVFESDWNKTFQDFATFLGENSFTFCFEFVTSHLGDHGDKPLLPYAVLTSITQFNEITQVSRFAGVPEMVELACRFRLILNEMWIVDYPNALSVSEELHRMRWKCYDADFTNYLDSVACYKVHTLLPHVEGQGQLLEGLVVQICKTATHVLEGLQSNSLSLMAYHENLIGKLKQFESEL